MSVRFGENAFSIAIQIGAYRIAIAVGTEFHPFKRVQLSNAWIVSFAWASFGWSK